MEKFNNCLNALSFNSMFTSDDPNIPFDFYDDFCLFYKLCFPKMNAKINAKTMDI